MDTLHSSVNPTVLSEQLAWLRALLEAQSSDQVVAQIGLLLHSHPDFVGVAMSGRSGEGAMPARAPAESPVAVGLTPEVAATTIRTDWSADGRHATFLLSDAEDPPALVLSFARAPSGRRLQAPWEQSLGLAVQHLRRLLALETLCASIPALERSEQVQRALFAISELSGSERDMAEVLKGIHAIVGSLMYAENFFIVWLDAAQNLMRFLYFVDVEDPPPEGDIRLDDREGSLTWYVLHDGKALRGDTAQLQAQASGPLRIIGTDSYDWMGVPMLRDGVVQGAIVVQSYEPGIVYTADDQALLEFVGSHILTALERKQNQDVLERTVRQRTLELAEANVGLQLEVAERKRSERLQAAVFQIAQLATADIGEEQFYRRIHEVVGELLNARNFYIALLSEEREVLHFPYYVDDKVQRHQTQRARGRGVSEYVLRNPKPLLASSRETLDLAKAGEIELPADAQVAVCWLGVPLLFGDEAVGLVVVQSYDPQVVYGPSEQEILEFVASQIANSLNRRRSAQIQQQAFAQLEQRVQERTQELRNEIQERERIQDRLQHEVLHDPLTGLPNRGYLRERLERVLALLRREPHRQCALLYLDIDRFKVINDSLGHLAGDSFLKEIALRLVSCMREPDLVARLSGDEFAILLEDVPEPAIAVRVAQRILNALAAPLQISGRELEPSASIGIAIAGSSYKLADDVLRDADIALYRAKALGRKRFELFDVSLQKRAVDVLTMERELRVALQQDEFVPYFQPILCLEDGVVQGYEALIRWNHPLQGLIGPGDFLRIAEDSGNIEAIDWWMFEHSCALAAQYFADNRYLTINVSPLHFRRADFCERLLGMLQRTSLPPWRLVIEVTEGSLLDDPDGVRDILAKLRYEGVSASLDDFGTGYSSLSYLHTFPLRIVKIDRSFVARLGEHGHANSEAVVASILALARALDVEAVAEGIETQAQRDMLLAMGCRFGQGYLLGRPAAIDAWSAPQPG